MAILESLKGVEIKVLVEGQPAKEYEENDPKELEKIPPNTMLRYIESRSGAKFSIEYNIEREYKFKPSALCFDLYIDGMYCDGLLMKESWVRKNGGQFVIRGARYRNKKSYVQPFVFDFVSTVETEPSDPKVERDRSLTKEWAKIEVFVKRVQPIRAQKEDVGEPKRGAKLSDIAEKALKGRAVSHGMSFGEPELGTSTTSWHVSYPDGYDNPVAKFVFEYRSLRALNQLKIISDKDYIDMISHDEIKEEFLERLGSTQKINRVIPADAPSRKRKRDDDEPEEPRQLRRKQTRVEPETVVIDD